MIFITVGTANKGFDRLISACDEIARNTDIDFFAQIGFSIYKPQNFEYKKWLTAEEMITMYQNATAFIVHGGFGTISETLKYQKPILVVPRSFSDDEAVNDQFDLAWKLDKLGYVTCIQDISKLKQILLNINTKFYNKYTRSDLVPKIINEYINNMRKFD